MRAGDSADGIGFCMLTGCGAAWLARLLWEQEAAGSNPAIPTESAGERVVAKPHKRYQDHLTVV